MVVREVQGLGRGIGSIYDGLPKVLPHFHFVIVIYVIGVCGGCTNTDIYFI